MTRSRKIQSTRQLHLNLFYVRCGYHQAAWRQGSVDPGEGLSLDSYLQYVQRAEAAQFDAIFLADSLTVSERGGGQVFLDPMALLSAFAARTDRIGLIATVSTTFMPPFHLARKFASLDHLSNGRAGWNIVTSSTDDQARNFGLDEIPDHASRYERAREYVDVVLKLWDSWDDDALVLDQESGIYADPARVRAISHAGPHYRCEGPLTVPRPPQGYPVLVQAGASEDGREFAGQFAEVVFTAEQTLPGAQASYADLKARAAGYGRDESEIKILPGLITVVGSSEQHAIEQYEQLNSLTDVDAELRQLSTLVEVQLTREQLDGPLPPLPSTIKGSQSRAQLIADLAQREQLTIRQLLGRLTGRGHMVVVGTGEQIADQMEEWFTTDAADGFNISPALNTPGLEDFITQVVPELQRRGLFRTEYSGATLREHYGIRRPAARTFPTTPGIPTPTHV